jgi:hypothetical protein
MGNASSNGASGGSGSSPSSSSTPTSGDLSREELEGELAPGGTGAERMSMMQQMKMAYASVIDAIIRPPRAKYTEASFLPSFECALRIFSANFHLLFLGVFPLSFCSGISDRASLSSEAGSLSDETLSF